MSCFGSEKGNLKRMEIGRERGERDKEWERKEGREIIFAEQPVFSTGQVRSRRSLSVFVFVLFFGTKT